MKGHHRFVGGSAVTQELLSYIGRVAPSDAPVLIRGATGVGKEVIAREIHRLSGRDNVGKFVAVNCSAIPTELLESELFGHEKGAFSGAVTSYPGRMRLADGGSLLLDEIGDMPSELQAKLLRAIQEGVVTPVGAVEEVAVDVRVISATHKPLEALIDAGKFREDLFFRLNVIPITIPPLRERPEEIIELFEYFSHGYALQDDPIKLDAKSVSLLQVYRWPGNVRELENFCRRLTALFPGETVDLYSLPKDFLPPQMARMLTGDAPSQSDHGLLGPTQVEATTALLTPDENDEEDGMGRVLSITSAEAPTHLELVQATLKARVAHFERELIERALSDANSNISEAARMLGVKRTTLIEKMGRLKIKKS